MTLIEILLAVGLILLLAVASVLGVRDARRRSRDTERLSAVRVLQADLERFRHQRGSYPETLEVAGLAAPSWSAYRPQPEGCGADREQLCRSYALRFDLEGRVGSLRGGACQAGPEGITCGNAP